MSIQPLIGTPGISSARTASYRNVLRALDNARYFPGGGRIDGASRDGGNTDNLFLLRPGLPMGRVTSSKRFKPSIIGPVVTTALTNTATTLKLSVAQAAELLRRVGASGTFKLTGPPTAAGVVRTVTVTYSAIDTATGFVTITAIGVNEVQTINFGAAATAGTFKIGFTLASGAVVWTDTIAWNATDATFLASMNTAIDNVLGAGLVVATAIAVTDTDLGFVLTFSGAGYTALPQTLVAIDAAALTSVSTVTVTRTTTGVDGRFVVGSFVQPADGSETPRILIGDGTGVLVPSDSSHVDWPHMLVGGDIDSSQIIDWPSDTSLQQWLVDSLNANGYGRFTFDHLLGPA